MAVTFTRDDLLADISDKELTALAGKLVASGQADPAEVAIERARDTIDLFAGRYALPAELERRLISAIAVWEIVSRLSEPEEKHKLAWSEATRTLREIRDGKFPNLVERNPLPATIAPTSGGFGSAPFVRTSRF